MERKLKFQVCIFLCVISFGLKCAATVSAQSAGIYELKKGNFSAKFTSWGASIVSLILPDKTGKLADIVLGFQAVDEYKNNTPNFGAIVGRVANRIKGAQFSLNGIVYKIIANDGNNTLHGGEFGFAHVLWKVTNYQKCCDNPSITFSYLSPDGDQGHHETTPWLKLKTLLNHRLNDLSTPAGFPGDLLAKVTYKIVGGTELRVIMSAKALKTETPVNLAQHTYWNLGGHDSGTILLNKVKILANHYTPVDSELIPTGKLKSVVGTPFDFLKSQTVGSRIQKLPTGYDINYALEAANELKIAAVVHDEKSGRVMQLRTNAVGMQLYTANSLKDVKGKGGFVYQPHSALCLETQGFPNAVNQPNFPSQIVVPAKPYKHVMVYKFSTVK